MYAVIASGGKQYRVALGDIIKLEQLDIETGKSVDFDKVLLTADGENIKIGSLVKAVFRKIQEHGEQGVVHYGYKFKLVR